MVSRRAPAVLLVVEALLLAATLPVIGFLVLWGSVWEGDPDVLARRRTAVRWMLAGGLGNALAVALLVVAVTRVNRPGGRRATGWAAAWVGALAVGWTLLFGASTWPVGLLLVGPVVAALLLSGP